MNAGSCRSSRVRLRHLSGVVLCIVLCGRAVRAESPGDGLGKGPAEQAALQEIGAKLANPASDVWALFTQFGVTFSDGDLNTGEPEVGSSLVLQPILPLPLYGKGGDAWKLIVRPVVPILFSETIPDGFDSFRRRGGLGDIQIPMLLSPPAGGWILGAGPAWLLPTSTNDAFGHQQWGVGPAAVVGYETKDVTIGVFPQYYLGIQSRDPGKGTPDASFLDLLYFMFYNLPDAWQVGFNPTIRYDDKAPSDNRWNVPIGLTVAKTTRFGRLPVKLQAGIEYSIVSPKLYGQRLLFKLDLIPVLPALLESPIFGVR